MSRASVRSILFVLAVLLAAPAQASAHGGEQIASGENAVYSLSVQASKARDGAGKPVIDLTAYPVRKSNGAPDQDARVTIRIDGRAPIRARRSGDGYEALVPAPRGDAWRQWRVRATVAGSPGTLTIAGAPEPAAQSGRPGWVVPSGVILVLAGLGALALVRRRSA